MKSNDQPKETIHKQTHRNVISSFTGKYAFLSNFYPAPVTYMGQTYANNEAAFQAQKTCCAKEQQQFSIFRLHNPAEAKKRGKNLTLRPDWDKVKISLMYEINGDYLDDERANLNVQLSQPILVVGDLGLWNGRRMGYKEIPSGNIRDCLYSDTDYSTWYVDRLGDLRCDAIHHDGTNFYLYRVYKDSASPSQIELLKEKLYRGIATRADITRVTRRLGDDIAKVYGFSIPLQRQAAAMER